MSTTTTDKTARTVTTIFQVDDNRYLEVATWHNQFSKRIETDVRRFVREAPHSKTYRVGRTQQPAPVSDESFPVARYSLKTLENAHASFMSRNVYAMNALDALSEWARALKL